MPPGVAGRRTAPDGLPAYKTYYPTWEEFKDFTKYMEFLERDGAHEIGVARIVPPKEWVPRRKGYNVEDFNYEIAGPIKQYFNQIGSRGCYQTKGVVQNKTTVVEYEKMANSSQFKTPLHSSYEELERKYWKGLSFCPPIYGCDVADSITDEDQKSWNIRNLGTILNLVNDDYEQTIQGVNSPYLYFGMWKATFSWHVEDMDLHSINYLHSGAPKTWYVVPPKYGYLMEKAARQLFPNVASWCSNFMRHKTCLISPQVLDQMGVPYQKVVQEERNAIIVFPYAYHSGFNHGFNIAESTNFALERWIEYGKRARQCDCSRSRVTFSMDTFVKKYQPEKFGDWKAGRDIAPHPEDPEDVRQEIMLRAENPAEYAKMMQERMWLGEKAKKSKAKPRNTCPMPENDAASNNLKTFHVYQHHEMHMLRVLLDPETMKCYRGLQNYKDMMELDDAPNFRELVANGILIHIDDEQVNVTRKADEPPEISTDIEVYQHTEQSHLEALVHPIALTLIGDQSKELMDYLQQGSIKDEIKMGRFKFMYRGMIRIPNPNYVPETQNEESQQSLVKADLKKITLEEDVVITANIYQHAILKELICLTPDHSVVGEQPTAAFFESVENRGVNDLLTSGLLIKVAERKVHLPIKIPNLLSGNFTYGEEEINVEVLVAKNSLVYKFKTGYDDVMQTVKLNTFKDLVNSRILVKKPPQEDDKHSEVMLAALIRSCVIQKCTQHQNKKQTLSSEIRMECGCRVKGQRHLLRRLQSNQDLMVIVDEETNTVTLVFGSDTLMVKCQETVPHDMLETAVKEEISYVDSEDDENAYTSDEVQESGDAESSDDPDFGSGFNQYSWRHRPTANTLKRRRMRKQALMAPAKRQKRDADYQPGQSKRVYRRQIQFNYPRFLAVMKAALDHLERNSTDDNIIVALELAEAIQQQNSYVIKALELLKLFEIVELIDPIQHAYQWVSKTPERLKYLIQRFNAEEAESTDDIDDLATIVRGVIKMFIQSRRGKRFYTEMIACELFSDEQLDKVNYVLVTLEALDLVTQQFDYASGFEYCGPDIDAEVRQKLFDREQAEFKLRGCTVNLKRQNLPEGCPMPFIQRRPKKTHIYGRNFRMHWDSKKFEEERQRSITNSDIKCKCGTQKVANIQMGKNRFKTTVYTGFKKRSRCKNCTGCLASKCGTCPPCVNPRMKQSCILTKCLYPVVPKCPCFM